MASGGGKSKRLQQMAAAEAEPAPDLLGDMAPEIERRMPLLPHPSPIIPLGVLGKQLVFLDRLQQIVIEAPRGCSKGEMKLWAGNEWLVESFPQWPKGSDRKGMAPTFNQDDAQTALVEDCAALGTFDPTGKVLGRGAHRPQADETALVLHMGRKVLISRPGAELEEHPAGMVTIAGKKVFFPAGAPLLPPATKPSTRAEYLELADKLGTWNWVERDAAVTLLIGWVAQAFVGGAMEWRAHVWLPGPTASGKSSLQKIIRALLDEWVLRTADASEAALRQRLGTDTIAVSIDEAEAHDNPERLQAVMNLMKKSSSGDVVMRGSADHKAQEFQAQSPFLLSSVLHAPFRGEDRNRIALLELRDLAHQTPDFEMELARWRVTGRRMHRRMIEQWPRFARTLLHYKRAIGRHGFAGRWQDTYGTLLACADLLQFDFAPDDELRLVDMAGNMLDEPEPGMARVEAAVDGILPLLSKGRVEARTDVERVLLHLATYRLPGAHGAAPAPIGRWIERAMTLQMGENPLVGELPSVVDHAAREKLRDHGLRVVRMVTKTGTDGLAKIGYEDALTGDEGWGTGFLAVAYGTHQGTAEIFKGSDWAGGNWVQSLKKVPDAIPKPVKMRFAGNVDNACLVPLSAFRGEEG